jgi:hypothetical protein
MEGSLPETDHEYQSRKQAAIDRVIAGESLLSVSLKSGFDRHSLKKWTYGRTFPKPPAQQPPTSPSPTPLPPVVRHASKPSLPSVATVLAIPDMHHPFAHCDALHFLLEVRRTKRTTLALCLGDEIDAHAFSKYPMDPDGMSPGQELQKAVEALIPFYREFPDMLVCESNHTVRPWKRSFEAGLPAAFLPTYATVLNAPDGWWWEPRWEIDGVLYIHGDNGRSGQSAPVQYMKLHKKSVVIGHIHAFGGVQYEGPNFAANAGCLINESAYCFKYAKNNPVPPSLGCVVVHEGKWAEFIPMLLNAHGRWVGRFPC